jgi:hypothetical protein
MRESIFDGRVAEERRRRTGQACLFDRDEGDKVFINQIVINGVTGSVNTRRTKRAGDSTGDSDRRRRRAPGRSRF